MKVSVRKRALFVGVAAAVYASPWTANASGLLMECSESRLFIGYNVDETDECTANRVIRIFGADGLLRESSEDAFIVAVGSDGATIELLPGDSGRIEATMTCETIQGQQGTFSGDDNATRTTIFQSFENGCNRDEADLGGSLRPELNDALDTNLDEQNAPIIITRPDAVDEDAAEVTVEDNEQVVNTTTTPTTTTPTTNPNAALDERIQAIVEQIQRSGGSN